MQVQDRGHRDTGAGKPGCCVFIHRKPAGSLFDLLIPIVIATREIPTGGEQLYFIHSKGHQFKDALCSVHHQERKSTSN